MTFSYDPTTDIGKVRRTIPDKISDDYFWTDEEIQSFIDDEGDWRRATALALETMASDSALVLQVMRIQNIQTDGASVVRALLQRASTLRQQAYEAEDAFEVIEMVNDDFSYRQRIRNEALRQQ